MRRRGWWSGSPCGRWAEPAPVGRGGEAGFAAHQGAEVGGGAESGAAGDDVEALLPQFDEAAGEGDAFAGEPGEWGGAKLGLEAAVQGGGADGCLCGEVGDGEGGVEVLLGPGEDGGE